MARVLIIDDDPEMREMLGQVLTLKKQLLQVVGGKRNLFLRVGAKTYFSGEALKKQLL